MEDRLQSLKSFVECLSPTNEPSTIMLTSAPAFSIVFRILALLLSALCATSELPQVARCKTADLTVFILVFANIYTVLVV